MLHESPLGFPLHRRFMGRRCGAPVAPAIRIPCGFTLVELLVVIGIISILMAMLMPTLTHVRNQANSIKCKSNLYQINLALEMYANNNNGMLYPVGPPLGDVVSGTDKQYLTLGYCSPVVQPNGTVLKTPQPPLGTSPDAPPPNTVWTVFVFEGVWNPPVMCCPNDVQPFAQHSYMLNSYIEYSPAHTIKANDIVRVYNPDGSIGSRSSSLTVLMGEKMWNVYDYYMETGDFEEGKVDEYKHGLQLGSNYLYLDGHVDIEPPTAIETSLDPWDPGGTAVSNN